MVSASAGLALGDLQRGRRGATPRPAQRRDDSLDPAGPATQRRRNRAAGESPPVAAASVSFSRRENAISRSSSARPLPGPASSDSSPTSAVSRCSIEVSDASPVGTGRQSFMHDPSGNLVELHQPAG